MKKPITIVLVLAILFGCSNKSSSDAVTIKDDIIEINVMKAYQDKREFPLSELVKDVEILQLESVPESFFEDARSFKMGKKYIMIACQRQNKVLLFDRSGKFLQTIGREGEGPGEYNRAAFATMDPAEENVIIVDFMSRKIIHYSIDGTYINQRDVREECPQWPTQNQPFFLDDNHFAFSRDRPRAPTDDYHTLYVYDLDLNLVSTMIPRPNDEALSLANLVHRSQEMGAEGPFYWETFTDTLYYLSSDGTADATYSFTIDNNKHTIESMTNLTSASEEEEYYQIGGFTDLKRYLMAWCILKTSCWMVYDKKTKEAFVTAHPVDCKKPINTWVTHWMKNDVFGFQTALMNYNPEKNLMVSILSQEYIPMTTDIDCIRKLEVTHPKIRDQLCDMVENYTGEELPVLVIMHLK